MINRFLLVILYIVIILALAPKAIETGKDMAASITKMSQDHLKDL